MALWDDLANALGGQAGQQDSTDLPPLTIQDFIQRQREGGIREAAAQEGIYPQMGMEAFPMGPGGRAPRLPAPGARQPLTGQVMGGEIVGPLRAAPGVGRGQTYEGTLNTGQTAGGAGGLAGALQRAFGVGGARGGAAGTGGGGTPPPRARRTNPRGEPAPDSGPIPMGGQTAGQPRAATPYPDSRLGRIQENFANLPFVQKLGVLGTGAIGSMELGRTLANTFGGGAAESGPSGPMLSLEDALARGGAGAAGGLAGAARVTELPRPWRSQLQEMVPEVDYDSLPRPDYDEAYEALWSLAPEAPEERNWLDRLPANAKNMIGFGLLLGPLGLLLGAGLGMSENRSIDRAQQDAFKQQSREFLEGMIRQRIDWTAAERQLALGEQQGARDQARENIELERTFQQWGMDDASWQQEMTNARLREAAARQGLSGGNRTMERLWEYANTAAPDAVQGMMQEQFRNLDPMALQNMTNDQRNALTESIQSNIIRALYGQ